MTTLQACLRDWAGDGATRRDVAATLIALANASVRVARIISDGPLAGDVGSWAGESDDMGAQTMLESVASDIFLAALEDAPIAALALQQDEEPIALNAGAPLAVSICALDGSGNLDSNAPVGTIFAIRPCVYAERSLGEHHGLAAMFRQPGTQQLAAGFILHGPYTSLVLTVRCGVQVFTLDRTAAVYRRTRAAARIPVGCREYAIHASDQRYWPWPVRAFIEGCVAGTDGPRGGDFSLRWLGCVVAEVFRILTRGGVYIYPGDRRPGYRRGHIRLLHQAHPLALIAEEADGAATDGFGPILQLVAEDLSQRVSFILGARDEVKRLTAHHIVRLPEGTHAPLFAERGLIRG